MVLVLSRAHTKRTWLLLCFSSPCLSATNIKRVCPYMAGQMFALTAQSVCVCRWVLSVCAGSDRLISGLTKRDSCFLLFPLGSSQSLYIHYVDYYSLTKLCSSQPWVDESLSEFLPSAANLDLCASVCILARFICFNATSKFRFALCNTTEGQHSQHLLWDWSRLSPSMSRERAGSRKY